MRVFLTQQALQGLQHLFPESRAATSSPFALSTFQPSEASPGGCLGVPHPAGAPRLAVLAPGVGARGPALLARATSGPLAATERVKLGSECGWRIQIRNARTEIGAGLRERRQRKRASRALQVGRTPGRVPQ